MSKVAATLDKFFITSRNLIIFKKFKKLKQKSAIRVRKEKYENLQFF